MIRINKSARQTESSQEQKNILLSDRAKADSDPKLEILNNDVIRCTHGAAVGPVDQEMVFYLESRGLDRAKADRFVGMYVNELTLDYGDRGRTAVQRLMDEAFAARLIPSKVIVEFAPE